MPFSMFVFLAALGVAMVMYVRRTLSRARKLDDPRGFGRRVFWRGIVGILAALVAGWTLPIPEDLALLFALRSLLLLVCLVSTTWLMAGIGVLESANRRGLP